MFTIITGAWNKSNTLQCHRTDCKRPSFLRLFSFRLHLFLSWSNSFTCRFCSIPLSSACLLFILVLYDWQTTVTFSIQLSPWRLGQAVPRRHEESNPIMNQSMISSSSQNVYINALISLTLSFFNCPLIVKRNWKTGEKWFRKIKRNKRVLEEIKDWGKKGDETRNLVLDRSNLTTQGEPKNGRLVVRHHQQFHQQPSWWASRQHAVQTASR